MTSLTAVQATPARPFQSMPSLADAVREAHWRIPARIGPFDVRLRAPDDTEAQGDVCRLTGVAGDSGFELCFPAAMMEALLAHLPEQEDFASLRAEDVALLLEHLVSDAITWFEGSFRTQVRFTSASIESGWPDQINTRVSLDVGRQTLPVGFRIEDDGLSGGVARAILAANKAGPMLQAGQPLVVGPIFLSHSEIDKLQVGDGIDLGPLDGTALSAGILYSEIECWPVALWDGRCVINGALTAMPRTLPDEEELAPTFIHLGVVRQPVKPTVGGDVSISGFGEGETFLSMNGMPLRYVTLQHDEEGLRVLIGERCAE